jgi:hypothetical protein
VGYLSPSEIELNLTSQRL